MPAHGGNPSATKTAGKGSKTSYKQVKQCEKGHLKKKKKSLKIFRRQDFCNLSFKVTKARYLAMLTLFKIMEISMGC